MKKKNLLYGLGGLAVVVAPVVSSVSYSTATPRQTNISAQQWQDFCKLVNDKQTEATLKSDWDAVKDKFFQSDFYKERINLQNGVWDVLDGPDIYSTIYSLLGDNRANFTDAEKITIAKEIVNNEAAADAFESFGFDPRITTNINTIKGVTGEVNDPTAPSEALTWEDLKNNTKGTLNSKGKTGINSDYTPGTYHDIELEISNSDVLKYFIDTFVRTTEFTNLYKSISKAEDDILAAPIGGIKDVIGSVFDEINKFVSKISTTKTQAKDLAVINCFNIFETLDLSTAKDDVETFTMIMDSNLGKALFGAKNSQQKLTSFISANATHRKILAAEVVGEIVTKLDSLKAVKSDQLTYLENNGVKLDNQDLINSLLSFAKEAVDSSKLFNYDVQIRSRTSIISGHSLAIKGDFNTLNWTDLYNSDLELAYWNLDSSPIQMSHKFAPKLLEESLKPIFSQQQSNQIVFDKEIKLNINEKIETTINNDNKGFFWQKIQFVFENGESEISSSSNFLTGNYAGVWKATVRFNFSNNSQLFTSNNQIKPNKIKEIHFLYSTSIKTIDAKADQDFIDYLNNEFDVQYSIISDEMKLVQNTDPNAPVIFAMNVKSINLLQKTTMEGTDHKTWSISFWNPSHIVTDLDYQIVQNPDL